MMMFMTLNVTIMVMNDVINLMITIQNIFCIILMDETNGR